MPFTARTFAVGVSTADVLGSEKTGQFGGDRFRNLGDSLSQCERKCTRWHTYCTPALTCARDWSACQCAFSSCRGSVWLTTIRPLLRYDWRRTASRFIEGARRHSNRLVIPPLHAEVAACHRHRLCHVSGITYWSGNRCYHRCVGLGLQRVVTGT